MPVLSDRSQMLPPGLCFICETTPLEGETIYDTGFDFDPGAVLPLAGRKYLCRSCVNAAASKFGWVSRTEARNAVTHSEIAAAKFVGVLDYLTSLSKALSPEVVEAEALKAPYFLSEDRLTETEPVFTPDVFEQFEEAISEEAPVKPAPKPKKAADVAEA